MMKDMCGIKAVALSELFFFNSHNIGRCPMLISLTPLV